MSPHPPTGASAGPAALAAVAAGGAAGALLRWSVGEVVTTGDALVVATAVVNVVGSFALAALPALRVVRRTPLLQLGLGPGLLGGFTTLSAASEQTRSLLEAGRVPAAAALVVLTLGASLAAVALARRRWPQEPGPDGPREQSR